MDKFEKKIMVVDRSTLFADKYFQGFSPDDIVDYESIILENYFYEKRGYVETRPEYKQPIAYCIIVNTDTNKIFAYQRAAKEEYNEARLRGKWSWGIGGHIDQIDTESENPVYASMLRELDEEVYVEDFEEPQIIGYINDDQTAVGEVHFGLLFLIKTKFKGVKPKDAEIAWGGFKTYHELEEIVKDPDAQVETWSEISLEQIRKVLNIEQ